MKKRKCIRNKPRLNMQLRKKAISMVLILSLLMAWMIQPLSSSAGELGTSSTQPEVQEGAFTPIQDGTISAEKVVLKAADLKKAKDAVVLQYIGEEQFDSGNHTMRLKEYEDLHTFVFQNLNGTRTMYVMDENVKYIDANGKAIDKDITLVSNSKGFGIVQNEVELLIPNSPQTGISMEHDGYSITLTPQGLVTRASAKQEENSVVYEGAFGTNTSLKYTPLLSGIKEDIILTSYMQNVRYTFVLETDGLCVRQNEGKYCLVNPAQKDPVFYLGDILVYDAIGKPDMGTMTVTTVEEGQEYLLTITVDDDFLSDPTTEYPVTIDPTITVSDSTTSGSIEDAPIFQNYQNSNFGTYAYNRVGTPSAAYGVGRTVVRLRGLIDSEEYQNITENQIIAASFYVTEASGGAAQMVELYPLKNTTWTESNVTWGNVGEISGALDSGALLSYNREADFDITALVIAWKNGTLNEEAGFILKHSNESLNKAICSSEFSTASKRPRVVVTYEVNIFLHPHQTNMIVGDTQTLRVTTNPEDQQVLWYSSDPTVVRVNDIGEVLAYKTGSATITAMFVDANENPAKASSKIDVSFPEGIYFLRNKQTQCYADIQGPTMAQGTEIHQWEFNGYGSQKWTFEHVENGYYSIKSNYKSDDSSAQYYMGVINSSTSLNADIVLCTGTLTDGMKWRIERTPSGAYKLIPNTGEANNYVLATSTSEGTNGAKLIQGAYVSNNNSYRDEWDIQQPPYTYTVKHYYDQGFELRFYNINSDIEELINSYHEQVAERFMRIFGLQIMKEFEACTSQADECKSTLTFATLVEPCDHFFNHLTKTALRQSVENGTLAKTVSIWTGHILQGNPTSDSIYNLHSIVMTPREVTDPTNNYANLSVQEIEKKYLAILMHEISHQLGAPDHYCYQDRGENNPCSNTDCDKCYRGYKETQQCLMANRGDFFQTTDQDMYCAECKTKIDTYLAQNLLPNNYK